MGNCSRKPKRKDKELNIHNEYFSDEQNSFVIGSTVQALGQVVATGNIINSDVII